MKKIVMAVLIIFLAPNIVKAYFCDDSDFNRLKKIASNINTSIDYEEKNGKITFNVKINNLHSEMFIVDSVTNKKYKYNGNELIIKDYNSGEKILYNVYPTDEYCEGKTLRTIRVNLPKANDFYKDELCLGISNYSLCQKWYGHNLSYEKWQEKILEYKKSLNEKNEGDGEKYKTYPFLEFLFKYYYIFLIIIILSSGLGIYFIEKKSNIYS